LVDRILAHDEKSGGKMARKASAAAKTPSNDKKNQKSILVTSEHKTIKHQTQTHT